MDDCHQPEETERENDRLSPSKQENIASQNPNHKEYLKNLEPLGLQGVGFDEVEIVPEFGEKFVHNRILI